MFVDPSMEEFQKTQKKKPGIDPETPAQAAENDAWLKQNASPQAPVAPTPGATGYQNPGVMPPTPITGPESVGPQFVPPPADPAVGDKKYDSFSQIANKNPGASTGGVQMSDGKWVEMGAGGDSMAMRMKNDPGGAFNTYLARATGNNPTKMYDPQTQQAVMNQYLGLTQAMGQGDKDQLAAQQVSNQREQFYREYGQRQGAQNLDRAKFGLDAQKANWTMSPERAREQAQLALIQGHVGRMAQTGEAPNETMIDAGNDLINGVVGNRGNGLPGSPTPGLPGVTASGSPSRSMKGVTDLSGLLGDKQLGPLVEKAATPQDKLHLILQSKGSDWVNKNWNQIMTAMAAKNPNTIDQLKQEAVASPVTTALGSIGNSARSLTDYLRGGDSNGNKTYGQIYASRRSVPLGESWRGMIGTQTESDRVNANIRRNLGK
jgi:hypothetical protein